jgi:hypothetical protein
VSSSSTKTTVSQSTTPEAYLAERGIDVEIPLAMLYEGLNVALQSHQ